MLDSLIKNSKFNYMLIFLGIMVVCAVAYYGEVLSFIEESSATSNQIETLSIEPSKQARNFKELPVVFAPRAANDNANIEVYLTELITTLKANHANEQGDILFHVRLKEIYDELTTNYPEQGDVYFKKVIESAFPKFAKDILALITKLVSYDEWLLQHLPDLNKMETNHQQDQVWQKRFEMFGRNVAEKIWDMELPEDDVRYDAVQDTVNLLQKSRGMEMEDRITALLNTFDQHYSDVDELIVESKGVIAQTILGLEAVQDELAAMTVDERQKQISEIRRSLAFSEEDIVYLATQDLKSERDWQNGNKYMQEREKVVAQLSGDELNKTLDALRDKHFQHRSNTIKKEEEHLGFFRYARERIYGVN